MSARHTPGPWIIVPRTSPKGTLMIESESGLVAIMEHSKTRPVTYEAAEANARLIAAAPDLLEALWVCMEHNRLHHGETHNTVIQARAAIAKATGVTS